MAPVPLAPSTRRSACRAIIGRPERRRNRPFGRSAAHRHLDSRGCAIRPRHMRKTHAEPRAASAVQRCRSRASPGGGRPPPARSPARGRSLPPTFRGFDRTAPAPCVAPPPGFRGPCPRHTRTARRRGSRCGRSRRRPEVCSEVRCRADCREARQGAADPRRFQRGRARSRDRCRRSRASGTHWSRGRARRRAQVDALGTSGRRPSHVSALASARSWFASRPARTVALWMRSTSPRTSSGSPRRSRSSRCICNPASGVRSWCAALARNRCCIVLASRTCCKQPVERVDDRRDLDRRSRGRQRTQVARRASEQLRRAAARADAARGRRRATRARSRRPRRAASARARRRGSRRPADCACAASRRPARRSRSPSGAPRRGSSRRRSTPSKKACWPGPRSGGGGRSAVPSTIAFVRRADLEDDPVDLIVDESLERLLRQVDVRAGRVDAEVLGDVECGIEQRAIVRVVGRAERDPVRDRARAGDHQQKRAHEECEQAAADARRSRRRHASPPSQM